jgi:hypothetical protein
MIYSFENCKPFFDFHHLILKLTNLAKTRPRPCRDLTETRSRLAQDSLGTQPRPNRTYPGHDRDPPESYVGPHWDLT